MSNRLILRCILRALEEVPVERNAPDATSREQFIHVLIIHQGFFRVLITTSSLCHFVIVICIHQATVEALRGYF